MTTTSADGETVHGSPCSDLIVVTSPEVTEVVGGEGNDVIYASPDVEKVEGGAGDDVIYGDPPEAGTKAAAEAPVYVPAEGSRSPGPATASITEKKCEAGVSCFGGDGSQELIGGSGNDKIFGQRGNDILKGNTGNDQLFGGVGDESLISGGEGNDLLSGGLGTDTLNGNEGSDLVRGDGTIDTIEDTGASGTDTLSFATGVTPGFHGVIPITGFPADSDSEERGVYVRLDGGEGVCGSQEGNPFEACDNDARYGGGSDQITATGFENVIGSPFADYIVGSSGPNRIDGGGGADVIYGGGSNDALYGGADGDYLDGQEGTDTVNGQGGVDNCAGETTESCSGSAESVSQRNRSKISVGFMVPTQPEAPPWVELYMVGSTGADHVNISYSEGIITFATEGESGQFDTTAEGGCSYESMTKVTCFATKTLDSIVVDGMGGNDTLALSGFSELTTPILLGGEGNDTLTAGNGTEDLLVDGNGNGEDSLSSGNFDDALINNEGKDKLEGGLGNDLLLSVALCEGDTLDGAKASEGDGADVNSSSWAKLPVAEGAAGVVASLESGKAGNTAGPACSSGETQTLLRIDDLEGTTGIDKLVGDGNANNLLGRLSKDELLGEAGKDNIESAEDGVKDTVVGGEPTTSPGDTCRYDAGLDSISGCETKNGV
jgi:Ca2+-binding RTX toxin-like protein